LEQKAFVVLAHQLYNAHPSSCADNCHAASVGTSYFL